MSERGNYATKVDLEELNQVKQDLHELSNEHNVTLSLVEEMKMAVSNNKSSSEKQLKAVKDQVGEISKQYIDIQYEAAQNKQFLED